MKTIPEKQNSLNRKKSLKNKKDIDLLFKKGRSLSVYPVRLVYILDDENGIKVSFSVSKKNFKRAVDRNRIKRLLKETFRINQKHLKPLGTKMMWIYTGKEMPDFNLIEKSVMEIINQLNTDYGRSQ